LLPATGVENLERTIREQLVSSLAPIDRFDVASLRTGTFPPLAFRSPSPVGSPSRLDEVECRGSARIAEPDTARQRHEPHESVVVRVRSTAQAQSCRMRRLAGPVGLVDVVSKDEVRGGLRGSPCT